MSWKPTASTLIVAPVSFWKSGARRWSGSAIWGPLNVSRWTETPANCCPPAAADPLAAGAEAAGTDAAGDGDGLAAVLHAETIRIALIAVATSRKRDSTGGSSSCDPCHRPAY